MFLIQTIDKEAVLTCITDALSKSTESASLRLAAFKCILSLSRSPVQLQTTFKDHDIWNHIQKVLHVAIVVCIYVCMPTSTFL